MGCSVPQLMHAQGTDFKTVDCVLDKSLGLLLGASSHLRAGGGALTLHSLSVDAGFLAGKGTLPLPPPGAPTQPNQQSSQARHKPTHTHSHWREVSFGENLCSVITAISGGACY